MLVIAAALREELETALNLCTDRSKARMGTVPLWTGNCSGQTVQAVKLGVGPARSAAALERVFAAMKPTQVLVIGYAGALDPGLKPGELVVVKRAHLLAGTSERLPLSEIRLEASYDLAESARLSSLARRSGLPFQCVEVLTSWSIIGDPEDKRQLFGRFQAAIVDMETAALARVAAAHAVPLSCVRAVSDTAEDDFLASLPYDPTAGTMRKAMNFLTAGDLLRRYGQWRERSLAARRNLSLFLEHLFKNSRQ